MQTDMLTPGLIDVVGGSPDALQWPITAAITRVVLTPSNVHFEASDLSRWPHVTPPGWEGGIQSTLWIIVRKDGKWRTTGSIEFYANRDGTGSPLSSAAKDWWYYAPEIGQPQPGDLVGLFIAAGDQRRKDVPSVRERSAIVTFTVPPGDTGDFRFGEASTVGDALPPPPPTEDERTLLQRLERLAVIESRLDDLAAEQGQLVQAIHVAEHKADAFRYDVRVFIREERVRQLAKTAKGDAKPT